MNVKAISGHTNPSGFSDLLKCLFLWSRPKHDGFPIIIMGGWMDDELHDESNNLLTHHIQRIIMDFPPSLDITKISISSPSSRFALDLTLVGFIGKDALFKHVPETMYQQQCSIEYSNAWVMTHAWPKEKSFRHFEFVQAMWLWDGRIYSIKNLEVEKFINLAIHTGIISHEGGGPWIKY